MTQRDENEVCLVLHECEYDVELAVNMLFETEEKVCVLNDMLMIPIPNCPFYLYHSVQNFVLFINLYPLVIICV